ncbi:MAG: hypothetical protein HYT94_02130 [Parcubacteria group bacterium]|nr:hypothetical protein [Parcubacteria group bacterium]
MSEVIEYKRKSPRNCAIVIIYDEWRERFFLQKKDSTYRVEICRQQLTPYGTSIRPCEDPEKTEEPEQAITRRLDKELEYAQEEICNAMRYWKPFHLHWEAPLQGTYICEVLVVILTEPYQWEHLVDLARSGGYKQGALELLDRSDVEVMIRKNLAGCQERGKNFFMGHREIILKEFLETLDELGVERFLEERCEAVAAS